MLVGALCESSYDVSPALAGVGRHWPDGRGVFTSLTLLNVSNNLIADEGVAKLVSALDEGTLHVISDVDLRCNPASAAAKDGARRALRRAIQARVA